MAISAADVKKLREETDAPMMECKAALEEAGGDYEKAKELLREKGKAAAAKRSDRSTSEGVAVFVTSPDSKRAGGVVLESETDFVAKNADFIELAEKLAAAFVDQEPGSDPLKVQVNGETVGTLIEQAVSKIRENIQLKKAVHLKSDAGIGVYVHHDRKIATAVKLEGSASDLVDAGKQVAVQIAWSAPKYIKKEEVSQDIIQKEIDIETQRALNEGKKEEVARNIAQGRVNKEFYASQVLLEQPWYKDTKKTVGQFLQEHSGAIQIVGFERLAVGEG